jgi:hypothetical protein
MTQLDTVREDPRLSALLQWREKLIDEGVVSRGSLKEAHVRLVLRSGRTNVDEIRMMLPGTVARHAEEMAQVLQDAVALTAVETDLTAIDSVPQSGFAPYVFGDDEHETTTIRLRRTGSAALEVSWPPYTGDEPRVIYRLVSSEGDNAYSPDSAYLLEATTATAVTDDRPVVEAVRHLQVWVNAGASRAEALAAQPVLHATGVVVGTLEGVEIHEDSGRVIGHWPALPGISAVHVHRIPAELADRDGPEFRIADKDQNLTGFVDYDAERGGRYRYRLRCEVEVDGIVRLSEAIERDIRISAVREPVTDLTLTTHGPHDAVVFDLEWTTPKFGQVLVFRTPSPPDADAQSSDQDEAVLDQAGLGHDVQLTHPAFERVDESGVRKTVMAGVSWPEGWNRAYFTPVTILDGRGRLGKTISEVRTGVITDVALIEYCNQQVLTFDWPDGAASVSVYIAPKNHDPRDGISGRSYEIALDNYEKYGGMRFNGKLPNCGCALHLVPVAFSGGRRVTGTPTTIEYRGLLRLWYHVEILRAPDGLPLTAMTSIQAEEDATGSPPFVLVNNPDRIPLSVNDGTAVNMSRPGLNGEPDSQWCKEFQWSELSTTGGETWAGDVRGLRGWIRLFAHLPCDRLQQLALLDPPVQALRLTPQAVSR